MWPMILGMSRDECKRILRRLELEAYASLVSALRAQGELSSEKRKLLQDIAATLNISMERHRAEIRRAVNDEKLATIAEHIAGPNTEKNWAIEGRRLMPLMPRLVPQTAFTALANNVANIAAAENAKLPPPAETVKLSAKFGNRLVSPSCEPSLLEAVIPPQRSNSPAEMACSTLSVVSQTKNNEDEENSRKRHRSSCEQTDSLSLPPPTKVPAVVQSPSSASPQPKLPLDPSSRQNHHSQEQPPQQKLQQPVLLLQSPIHQHMPKVQLQQPLSCVTQQQLQSQTLLHLQAQQPQPSPSQQRQQQPQEQKQPPQQQNHQQLQQKEHQLHSQQLPSQPLPVQQQQQQRIQKLQHISQTACIPKTESYPASIPPVKITLTAASSRVPVTTVTTSAVPTPPSTQKVIIMSSSGAPGSPSILQRSLSVPVVKTVSACGSPNAAQRPSSLILGGQPHNRAPISPPGSTAVGNIVTISTNTSNSVTLPSPGAAAVGSTTFIAQSTAPKLRTKSVQLPARIRTRPAGSIIIPMTPNQVSPATNTNQASNNIQTTQLKPTAQAGKPFVAIKPDNSMKMVPMSNIGNSTKILPKPAFSTSVQSPVYVMTSAAGGSLVTRTSSTGTVSRMVTINTASSPHSNSSLSDVRTAPTTVITKNMSKPLQTVHISAQSSNVSKGIGGKPNVILVQKPSGSTLSRSITLPHGGKEILGKVLVGKSGMPVGGHSSVLSLVKSSHIVHPATQQSGNLTTTATHGNVIVLDLSQEQLNKNSTLSDILRVSGIIPDDASASENTPTEAPEEGKLVQHVVNIENTEAHTPSTDSEKQFTERSTAPNEKSVHSIPVDNQEMQVQAYSEEVTVPSRRQDEETVEMVGELDPQTGIYSVHPSHVSVKGNHECSGDSVESSEDPVPKSSSKTMDIFSTAIASADIDLETFSYNEGEKVTLEENETECSRQHSKMNNNNNKITVESLSAQGGCAFITTTQHNQDHDFRSFLHENGSTTVASVFVEPTHMDTSEMHIEDFASQKIQAHEVA